MVYAKRRTARTYRKYGKKPTASTRRVRAIVKKEIDKSTEDKTWTLTLPSRFSSISSAWTEFSCFQPEQGLNVDDRVGNRIRLKSILLKGVIAQGSSQIITDDAYNVVRIVIAIWKGQAGITPLGTAGTTINQPVDHISLATQGAGLEKVLYDQFVTLQVTGTEKGEGDGYTPQLKKWMFYHKWTKWNNINFGDNSVTYPDRRVVISMISDSAGSPNPGFIVGYMVFKWEDA